MPSPLLANCPLQLTPLNERTPSTQQDVHLIFEKAQAASAQWQQTSIKKRIQYLKKLKKILYTHKDELAQLITQEIGKPILQSYMAEVYPSLSNLKHLIQKAPEWLQSREEEAPFTAKATLSKITYSPYGIIGIIGTWNYPLLLNLSTITEALMAGNTVIFKPSELSWMVAEKIEHLFKEADFPEGVFQTIYGEAEVGQMLIQGEADKYFFTGSVAVGRKIYSQLAEKGKPVVLELSGNDPLIAREDAPIDLTAKAAIWGAMINAGQNCIGTKRFLIHKSIYAPFKERCLKELNSLVLGPGKNWETQIGPLRREKEVLRCEELIQDALNQGATLLAGGKRATLNYPGHFFEPTLIENIQPSMKLWTEDYFGPIALLNSFETDEEAIEKANSGPLGLSAAIFSKDQKRAEQIASQLSCGTVTLNEVIWPIALPMYPFGGTKASGFGRTRGLEGLLEMVYTKTVFGKSARDRFRPHYFAPANKWTPKIPKWMGWFFK